MIYFLRAKKSGYIKIGYSINPEHRKASLQSAHYEELEFVGLMDGTINDETAIKQQFAKYNIRGEWYYPQQELLDFIASNTNRTDVNLVEKVGDSEFRIVFAKPLEYTMNFFLLARSHNLRVLTDEEFAFVFGIEGKKNTLLDWLKNLEVVDQQAIEEYAALMVD